MKRIGLIIWAGVIVQFGLINPIYSQEHGEEHSGECLEVDQGLFNYVDVPGIDDFHPGHMHGGITLRNTTKQIIMLYLRSGYNIPETKAKLIAEELNELFAIGHAPDIYVLSPGQHPEYAEPWHRPDSIYPANHWSKWSLWVIEFDEETGKLKHPHEVMLIDNGEVQGFKNRAPGGKFHYRVKQQVSGVTWSDVKRSEEINPRVVASWIGAYFEDQLAMFICSDPPEHTEDTFVTATLNRVFNKARSRSDEKFIPFLVWWGVLSGLAGNDVEDLQLMGQFIPKRFTGKHIRYGVPVHDE